MIIRYVPLKIKSIAFHVSYGQHTKIHDFVKITCVEEKESEEIMISHEKDFRFLNLTNYLRAKNCFFRICLEKIRMQLLLHCSMFLFGFVLLDLVPFNLSYFQRNFKIYFRYYKKHFKPVSLQQNQYNYKFNIKK